MSGRPRIEPTEENLKRFFHAQMNATKDQIATFQEYGGDDGYDYVTAAIDLAGVMVELYYESDLDRFDALMNTEIPEYMQDTTGPDDTLYKKWEEFQEKYHMPHLQEYACDGVANEFYEEAPALYDSTED